MLSSGMDSNLVIERLGGPTAVAQLCDITPQAVSQWRTNGIPKSWIKYLRAVRPEVFGPDSEGLPVADSVAA